MIYLDNISYLFLSIEFAHERSQIGTVQSVGYIEVRSPHRRSPNWGAVGWSLSPERETVSVRGGCLCPGGFLSRRSLSRGVSVQGGLCPGGLCLGGLCPGDLYPGGVLCPGEFSVQEGICLGHPTGMHSCLEKI